MYIQGSEIDKVFKGSLEHREGVIRDAIFEHFDAPVRIFATHEDHAYVMGESGEIFRVEYKNDGHGGISGVESKKTKDIDVIDEESIPSFVSDMLRDIARKTMLGEDVSRTQVRQIAQLIDADEVYWVSDVLEKMGESIEDSQWYEMYEANQEKIRTSLYGKIKQVESAFPSTRFKKIPNSRLGEFESEIREGVCLISELIKDLVDECKNMVFDQSRDEFFRAICESLTVEAQAIGGLLGKAEKLMRSEDVGRIAEAHDRFAERAKTMAVVVEYLKGKSQRSNDEE